MGTPVWKGATGITLLAGYPKIQGQLSKRTAVAKYAAPWQTILSSVPIIGAQSPDLPPDLEIETYDQERGDTTDGILTVHFKTADGVAPSTPPVLPRTEILVRWERVQKRLKEHPRYNSAPLALTAEQFAKIENALNERDDGKRAAIVAAFTGAQPELYASLESGNDSYWISIPIVTRITHSYTKPTSGVALNLRQLPPDYPGYATRWLKTQDEARPNGQIWQRVEEWTGVDRINENVYAEAVPPTAP